MRLVHLTDPHLSSLKDVAFTSLRGKRWSGYVSWSKNRRHHHLRAVLRKLTAAVQAEKPDQILLTGDLVQIGLDLEFEQARNWLQTLGPPERIVLVPGNHDIYAVGSAQGAYKAWRQYMTRSETVQGLTFPVERTVGRLKIIGLSSACATPWFMANGQLGRRQLQRLDKMLDSARLAGQLVCLLIHHPPLPGMTNRRKGLDDAAALMSLLDRYPPMLLFHGHLHHNREQLHGQSRIFCTAAASSVADASFRIIDIEESPACRRLRMTLKSIALDKAGEPVFVTVDEQHWQFPLQTSHTA